ncbi:hypothetical protein L9F63_018119, partial [Diploptera punctata]
MTESFAEKIFVVPDKESLRTFEHDDSLPRLPVPALQHTLERYLDSVKPFLSDEEMDHTTKLVSEFEQGVGKTLHAKLLKRAKSEKNWLERWWEEIVYLSNRMPLLPFSSMIGIGVSDELFWGAGDLTDQIKNAALLCHFVVDMWQLLRKQKLRPDQSRVDKKYFSMYGFRRLFNCVRIPGEIQDTMAMYFRTVSEGNCPSQVIVLCEGHIFSMNALDSKGGQLTPPEWEHQLSLIKEKCKKTKGQNISLLTCTDRTTWAKNRLHLERLNVENRMAINTIDTAMFVLCLDSEAATTSSEIGQLSLCGNLESRWADKSLNCIVFKNGVEGILSEHSAYDGMVSIMSMNYVNMRVREMDWKWNGSHAVRALPEPEEILLKTDSYIEQQIIEAKLYTQANISCMVLHRDKFPGYGKMLIQSFKLHPDSFVQIALQMAYYKLHGKPAPTYETATTREFYHGRTETLRTCTPEAIEFVKSMLSSNVAISKRRELLKKAAEKHVFLMKEAKSNAGCDRHLLGLYVLAIQHGGTVPPIFTDPAFVKSGGNGNFILSTSLTGYTPLGGGVAPMCRDGYGCFYNICPD